MTPSASPATLSRIAPSQWRMPIVPEDYPDRNPFLTSEEKALMEQYLACASGRGEGRRLGNILARLSRFEHPFRDTVRMTTSIDGAASCRRHLFRYMVHTGKAFWAWPKEIWAEVIQSMPIERNADTTKFKMINLAYLFGDFLYVGLSIKYRLMAEAIFGKAIVEAEVNKLFIPLAAMGYATENTKGYFKLCCLAMLVNRCPCIEALSAPILMSVQHLLVDLPGFMGRDGRKDLRGLQRALYALDILDEPTILEPTQNRTLSYPAVWKDDPAIDPRWLDWVCAFYEQTPHRSETTIRHQCYHLLTAGRWLKKVHPEVYEPSQWGEALATEYVTYSCRAVCGDQMLPSNPQYTRYQKAPQQLTPRSIDCRLGAVRIFFSALQRRTYVINGRHAPKLRLTWLPNEAFKTPDDILAAAQPNPRDIQEDAWFKLIWAACTLTKEQLLATGHRHYPLAYYRAACLIWVTAARRSDEIRRLSVGCVRREWAPEMRDEQGSQVEPEEELCYLRVPTNKLRGEFYVPIPAYVADAIEVWEQLRPPHQKVLEDRKTHKPTHYLFQCRNQVMSEDFLNHHAIPLLCTLAGVSQTDVVGRITSHRARATTATWMYKMGMPPADIGKLLGHTNPLQSLPWYLREDKHRLGRAYRKANPLERYVAAILDTNAQAKQDPCVFYYLADGPDGRPRMCGNPHFSRCIHQLMCAECEAFIDHELAEAIEQREGTIVITVPIPLPSQMVAELNEQDETGTEQAPGKKDIPPPLLPSPAFHFNKKVPMRVATPQPEDLHARLADLEAQIAQKQGKSDRRSATMRALLQERTEIRGRLAAQEQNLS